MKPSFNDNEHWTLALLIGYEQVRELEEVPPDMKMPKVPKGKRR